MHYCRRDSHATSRTLINTNIMQTGRIRVYCSWFWVVLGGFGWFRVLVTTPTIASYYSEGDRSHFCPNKHVQHAVKINTEDKRRETCMYTSFLKIKPRTNSTLPIHRISKSISENKHGGETEETCMFTLFFTLEPRTTVLCQYTEFQKPGVKINTEDKHRKTCKFTSFFKREPQGKYEATLTFSKGIRFTQKNFVG